MVLAEREEGDGTFDHLRQLAVSPSVADGREGSEDFGIALIPDGRVIERAKVTARGIDCSGIVNIQAERREDLAEVALEPLPVRVSNRPWMDQVQARGQFGRVSSRVIIHVSLPSRSM